MSALVDGFLAYPRFLFNFIFVRGFADLYEPGVLSMGLVTLMFIGVGIALLISVVTPPPPEPQQETDPRAPVLKQAGSTRRFVEGVLRVTILLTGGPLILHSLMVLYSLVVSTVDLGNILDTVNASLAYGAAYLPLHAGAARMRHRITRQSRDPESKPPLARPLRISLGLFELVFPVYFLASLSQVHRVPFHLMIRPAVVSAIGTVVAVTGVVAVVLLLLRGNPPVKG
jgi:hypothetical protein